MRTDGMSVVFQVYYSEDLGGFEMDIVGVNGKFDAVGLIALLKHYSTRSLVPEIAKVLEKIDNASWDVEVEVKYNEPETQYGTGFGDIFVIPGYYYIGNVIKVSQHPIESTESA